MKRLSILILVLLLSVLIIPLAGAQGGTIFDIAAGDYRLSTFEAAVEAAGLQESLSSGAWTVFAPSDAAFAKARLNPQNVSNLSPEELQSILLYHAVPGVVSLDQAKAMTGDQVMANGQNAGWKWFDGSLYINDNVRVIEPNILASNGYIHIVDAVILGPWPRPADQNDSGQQAGEEIRSEDLNMVEYLALDGRFSVTAQAIEYAGLEEMLSSGQWTFFAPANRAYRTYNNANPDNPTTGFSEEQMREFLLYHIYPGHMSIAKSRTMLGDIRMANGELAGTKWWRRNLYVNDFSRVAIRDIHVANGVIQGVRDVIVGPWPRMELMPEALTPGLIE